MDLKAIITLLVSRFEADGIRYGLMGGFALAFHGVPRSTVDLDFLVDQRDLPKLESIMSSLGYDCLYRSENVSQYVSPVKVYGEVDFLHAFRSAGLSMLERTEMLSAFDGEVMLRVLRPEDLIGLKMQAIKNDPARKNMDMGDIRNLLAAQGTHLDREKIREYAELLGTMDLLAEAEKPR